MCGYDPEWYDVYDEKPTLWQRIKAFFGFKPKEVVNDEETTTTV